MKYLCVVAVTRFEQRLIETAELHKRVVIALFDDIAVFHDENDVGFLNGREAVCDDERRAPLHYFRESFLYFYFGSSIYVARRFVQYEHGRIHEHYSRYAKELPLSLRYAVASVGNNRIVAVFKAHDEFVRVRFFGGGDYFFVRRVLFAVSDIFAYRTVEQPGVLKDHAEIFTKFAAFEFIYRYAVYANFSAFDVVKAHQEIYERRLSATRGSHYGDSLTVLDVEIEVFDKRFIAVRKVYAVDFYVAARVERKRSVVRFVFFIEEGKYARRRRRSRLKLGYDARYFVERLCILVGVGQKAGKLADAHTAADYEDSADYCDCGVNYTVYEARARIDHRGIEHGFSADFLEFAVYFGKAPFGDFFVRKRLHCFDIRKHFLAETAEFAASVGLLLEFVVTALCDEVGDDYGKGSDYYDDKRYEIVYSEHETQCADHGHYARKELRKALNESVGNLLYVRAHSRHEIAAARVVYDFQRHAVELLKSLSAYVANSAVGQLIRAVRNEPLKGSGNGCKRAELDKFFENPFEIHFSFSDYKVYGFAYDDGHEKRCRYLYESKEKGEDEPFTVGFHIGQKS